MEAVLAIIASAFAIIQGSVWMINGIQNYRAKKILAKASSVGFESMAEPQIRRATAHEPAGSLGSAAAILHRDSVPQRMHGSDTLPLAPQTGGVRSLTSSEGSESSQINEGPLTSEAIVEDWKAGTRFKRFVRGAWHATLIAFLPVFSIISPLGFAIVVLFPFREALADPGLYEDGSTSALVIGVIILVPGIFAFMHRPTSSVHKWIRRICFGVAVVLAILFTVAYAFVDPS